MSDSIDMHLINSQDAEQIALVEKMNVLLSEHRDLDEVIGRLLEACNSRPASDTKAEKTQTDIER